jgi:acetyl esterase/lipase
MPTPYPFADPLEEIDEMLATLDGSFPKVDGLEPQALRAQIQERAVPPGNIDDVASTEDLTLEGGLRLRLYHPHGAAANRPAVLFFHGGGFVFCSVETHDGFCRRLSRETGALVVSVDYRLAPEHPYPAALDDAVRALEWLVAAAPRLNLDQRRLLVAGDSAGGNLAAALCLVARDRADLPVAGQILLYPMIEPNFETDSYRRFGSGHYNTRDAMIWYWRQYLGSGDLTDPPAGAAPIRATSLGGLPPTIMVLPGRDPAASEGAAYADALRRAGVPLRLRLYPEMFHGFVTMMAFSPAEDARALLWADIAGFLIGAGGAKNG